MQNINNAEGLKADGCNLTGLELFAHNESDLNTYLGKLTRIKKLIYNRVPKCASKAVRLAFSRLGSKLGYATSNQDYMDYFYFSDDVKLQSIANSIVHSSEPGIVIRHIHFIDFTRFGLETPYYINIVRDPFNRILSWYYYKQYYLEDHPPKRLNMHPMHRYTSLTLDECVEQNDVACMTPHFYFTLIPWFCGHREICMKPSVEALQIAKRNVINYYPVVGYVENAGDFFKVAQKIWPQFFTGLEEVGDEMMKLNGHKTRKKAVPPSNLTKSILMSKLGLEYDFYNFIKQRFHCIRDLILNQ